MHVDSAPEDDRDGGADFFVSYTRSDKDWAEWVGWVLEDAGYRVILQAWDFNPGAHFVAEMHRAAQRSRRTVAVLSKAYQESVFASAEWQAAWVADPSGREGRLLVFRVEECEREGLLRQVVTVDLFGVSRVAARERLLASIRGDRRKPQIEPCFPRSDEVGAGAPEEPAFPSDTISNGGDSRSPSQWTLTRIADSITVVAATLVIVIAATGPVSVPTVIWAAPAAAVAVGLRALAQRSWPSLVQGLLIANAVGATVTVWAEPTRGIAPQVILTILAGLASATTTAAIVLPRAQSGRLLKLADLVAAASLPAFFLGILVKQTLNAGGVAAEVGLRLDAVAFFILAVMISVFWGIFVALRVVVEPPNSRRLLAALIALCLPNALADGIAAISGNHVLGLPAVLLVTVAVTLLIIAAVQQMLAKSAQGPPINTRAR